MWPSFGAAVSTPFSLSDPLSLSRSFSSILQVKKISMWQFVQKLSRLVLLISSPPRGVCTGWSPVMMPVPYPHPTLESLQPCCFSTWSVSSGLFILKYFKDILAKSPFFFQLQNSVVLYLGLQQVLTFILLLMSFWRSFPEIPWRSICVSFEFCTYGLVDNHCCTSAIPIDEDFY